jgi:hypothetical protein
VHAGCSRGNFEEITQAIFGRIAQDLQTFFQASMFRRLGLRDPRLRQVRRCLKAFHPANRPVNPLRVDGGGLQVVEAGTRLKVQTAVFRVGNQEAQASTLSG